eukprot:CAMPEP_0203895484 /NCGR_PEP_ID=MMETSP0359-20131031/38333_1 /ASSEMBLY_ACC=CAM_ASM_000338 /TAXON_ID=268821 /ORGANISM="Scrippsiella Hangoei, Strain SHTV-5" /LENGTH=525 /DNA_ID=CAMNT_0050817965 /DNA_START=88 /DNA_END=1665 /DNA_ORIENTATION=-
MAAVAVIKGGHPQQPIRERRMSAAVAFRVPGGFGAAAGYAVVPNYAPAAAMPGFALGQITPGYLPAAGFVATQGVPGFVSTVVPPGYVASSLYAVLPVGTMPSLSSSSSSGASASVASRPGAPAGLAKPCHVEVMMPPVGSGGYVASCQPTSAPSTHSGMVSGHVVTPQYQYAVLRHSQHQVPTQLYFAAARAVRKSVTGAPRLSPLTELTEGPYFEMASWVDLNTLCAVDATCRRLRDLNSEHIGPWRRMGQRAFEGLELQEDGAFDAEEEKQVVRWNETRQARRIFWKGRFRFFRDRLCTFAPPFGGNEISRVDQNDEVAYFRCHLYTDLLAQPTSPAIYLEVTVTENPDNLSMAVVDFESGGCSSITFSPDTGAVIRERKVRESPRKVEGAYITPLPTLPPGERFHGKLGLFLCGGQLAFFRRRVYDESTSIFRTSYVKRTGPWECTGFVSDLAWAAGRRLTPCLAFRNEGAYRVGIAPRLGTAPPLPVEAWHIRQSGEDLGWSGLDWEADPDTNMAGLLTA